MKNTITLFIFSIAFWLTSSAQPRGIKEFRFPQRVTIYETGPSCPNAAPVIRKLAEGNNKTPRNTSFTFEFDQLLRVITREPQYVYQVESGSLKLSGDIRYKGFDASNFITPDELKFTLRLIRKNGQSQDHLLTAFISNGIPEKASYNDNDTIGYVFSSYELTNLTFRYGNNNRLEVFTHHVNDYYMLVQNLDQGFALLQSIQPQLIDNFRVNQRNLVESERILTNVESAGIENKLSLQKDDPGRYLEKINAYRGLLNARKAELSQVWSSLHQVFYDKAMYHLRRNNLPRAKEYLSWSLEVNPLFAPALLQWAVINFREGDLREASCKADDILYNMPADPQTVSMTQDLLLDIFNEYLERGQNRLRKLDYTTALDEFESAKRMCDRYRHIKCDDDVFDGIRNAKYGIYSEMLEDARQDAAANNLEAAEAGARHALEYQKANAELRNDSEASQVLKAIRQKRYDNTIRKAVSLTDQKMYDAALDQISVADSLLELYDLQRPQDYSVLVSNAAKPRAIELLYEGQLYLNNNNLYQARECYRRSTDLQRKYFLAGDPDILKHSSELRKNIFTQQCLIAQNTIDSAYNQGIMFSAEIKYMEADAAFEFALNTADDNKECQIPVDSIELARIEIRPAVSFLSTLQQADEDQESGRYQSCIDNYEKASAYFNQMNIGRYGLTFNSDLFRYIKERTSNGMINYSGDWYREKGEPEKALELYKLLLSRNYDAKLISGSLYQLGLELGQRDKKRFPGGDWKELSKEYTGGDKRLKRLAKGYKSGYKS